MAEKLKYSKDVEKHILNGLQGGVSVKQILASMQHLQNSPKSMTTLYKTYGVLMETERARVNGAVGKKVIDQALDGCFKSQELFLRSKAGWSPTQTIVETEQDAEDDYDTSAADMLMGLLGFDTSSEETPKE